MYRLPADRPAVMGILNVTPDSFSDGGAFLDSSAALDHALRMVDEGADLVDVGGESTRPGAAEVPADEEWSRVGNILESLVRRGVPVSVDTRKAEVARRALDCGACVVNDVSGLRDPAMMDLVCSRPCAVCIMHMQGEPATMQIQPHYRDVVEEVLEFLLRQASEAVRRGKPSSDVWIDPGIGFGKTTEHNRALIRSLDRLVRTGYPVLLGVSRKSFIGRVLGGEATPLPVEDRLEGTLAVHVWAQLQGVRVLRVHDVLATRRCVEMVRWLRADGYPARD
ncbi:MAG: dihydropteroate synthase [Fimbriimonadaceae bacterium]